MDWEAVKKLSRQNPERSMDRECDKKKATQEERRKKGSVDANLSRNCWEAIELEEKVFSKKGKTQRDECNKQATQT